jgi:hypothetical protein
MMIFGEAVTNSFILYQNKIKESKCKKNYY